MRLLKRKTRKPREPSSPDSRPQWLPDDDGVLFSTVLQHDTQGGATSGMVCRWRHMCALQPATRRWLEDELALDANVVGALVADGTRPRILVRDDGVMINLRGINVNNPDEPEDMISLRLWMGGKTLLLAGDAISVLSRA